MTACHLGELEDFFDAQTQNSHGNNSLKQTYILLTKLYTELGECWEGLGHKQ